MKLLKIRDRRRKNQSGQAIVEYVLFLVLMVIAWTLVRSGLNEIQVMNQVIARPWDRMAGMIESGVLMPAEAAREVHPGHIDRSLTQFSE